MECPYCGNEVFKKHIEEHILDKHSEQREPGNMLPGDTFPVPTFS